MKADPSSNETQRRIDIALVVITLLVMVFAFRISAQQRNISIARDKSVARVQTEANR
jgi:Tfp pilus assembly protein PilX